MIIGITGGIGSGKSRIARELARRGYTVYDCDAEAKRIVAENGEVQQAIVALLGQEAFIDGRYNTAYVAKRVFAEPALREALNAIIHPAVIQDIERKQPDFIESAILYEAGLETLCDQVVVIDAPEDIRIARVLGRDYKGKATPENIAKIQARMRAQKAHRGDLYIFNDGKTETKVLVDDILAKRA